MKIYKSGAELVGSADHFKKLPFFQSFNEQHIKEILQASKMIIYDPGEIIIPEGGVDDKIYLLINGKANVMKGKLWIATLEETGELFGELPLLDNDTRSATVVAVGTTWCLAVSMSFLRKLSLQDQNAWYAAFYSLVARTLAERLKLSTEELAMVHKELALAKSKLERLRKQQQ